jgi:predicted DNA binding protein
MLEAVLAVETPREWRQEVIRKYHASISVLDCRSLPEGGCRNLIGITVDPEHTQMVVRDLERNETVEKTDLDVVAPGELKGVITTNVCIGCCTIVSKETFLVGVRMDEDGRIHQRIISKDRQTVREAIDKLEALGHTVSLESLSTLDPGSYLTSYQEDILHIATERGYFDNPKRVLLGELAEMFGISVSSMSEILRKALKKVMQEHFEEDR